MQSYRNARRTVRNGKSLERWTSPLYNDDSAAPPKMIAGSFIGTCIVSYERQNKKKMPSLLIIKVLTISGPETGVSIPSFTSLSVITAG